MQLSTLRDPVVRVEGAFKIHSLFGWRQISPPALSWLVQSLKGQEAEGRWRQMAVMMLDKFGSLPDAVIVPVPSRKKRNHAVGLASALSGLTGSPVKCALTPGENRSQKRLSRELRQEVHFEREIWNLCTEYTTVLVVDDVVTTGATIRAAFHALGRPRLFQAWCLLDRRPCAPSRRLL